jgi:tripartite-type tricarboxylate transporter receptor subunit TctC
MHRTRSCTCRVRRAALGLIATAALGLGTAAQAQDSYPSKPIRMIVPLAAGSAVDVAARVLVQKMSINMGQAITVENITGASGIIGASQLQRAAADGYTIGGFNDSILTMVPNINRNTPFDPLKDFSLVSQVAIIEFSAAVPTNSRYNTMAELIADAKANPGKVTYASGGVGSPQHMGGAMLAAHTGVQLRHVPFRGASQAAADVAGGQVDLTVQGIATVSALLKAGKLKLIGVPAQRRHPEYPNVPTFAEQGIQGFDYSTWFAVTGPAGMPRPIVERLQAEVVKALADPEVQARYAALGLTRTGTTPEQLQAITREQHARYGKVIREQGIQGE